MISIQTQKRTDMYNQTNGNNQWGKKKENRKNEPKKKNHIDETKVGSASGIQSNVSSFSSTFRPSFGIDSWEWKMFVLDQMEWSKT